MNEEKKEQQRLEDGARREPRQLSDFLLSGVSGLGRAEQAAPTGGRCSSPPAEEGKEKREGGV